MFGVLFLGFTIYYFRHSIINAMVNLMSKSHSSVVVVKKCILTDRSGLIVQIDYVPEIILPDYKKIEVFYSVLGRNYRYIEKFHNNYECNFFFPVYQEEILKTPVGSGGILSCEVLSGEDNFDITDLMLEYQGPRKNFYSDIENYSFSLRDIDHPGVTKDSYLVMTDFNFNEYVFYFDDEILLK